jgi:hypothetical protein
MRALVEAFRIWLGAAWSFDGHAGEREVHTHALLPSWSAMTVHEGARLSSTIVAPAATAAAIRWSATSGATQTETALPRRGTQQRPCG